MNLERYQYNLPPLNGLKAFEAVGRNLSFTQASRELCVTQSAVSRQITQLEGHLGVKLLERSNRGIKLTSIGAEYLEALTLAFRGISQSTAGLFPSTVSKTYQRTLKIGVGPAFAEYWLTSRIGQFRDRFPQLKLEIHINQYQYDKAVAPLAHVDVEIYTGANKIEGFSLEPLFQLIDYPVCSPFLIEGSLSSADELHNYTLLHESSVHWWLHWFKAVDCPTKADGAGPVIHDETLCIKLAVAGEGIALGDAISTAPYLKTGELVKPVIEGMVTNDWVSILIREGATSTPEIDLFCQWLRGEMAQFKLELELELE
ncbi:MAG: LysR family transcriptional regulator [Gammaproteobacteria bacterium]|nr:LysR family transcriptional regulator [Gammaproteobacteria bacterium]